MQGEGTTLVAYCRYPDVRAAYTQAWLATEPPITKSRLAREARVTYRHLCRIFAGDHRPEPKTRDALAAVLGVDPETLPCREAVVPPFLAAGVQARG